MVLPYTSDKRGEYDVLSLLSANAHTALYEEQITIEVGKILYCLLLRHVECAT